MSRQFPAALAALALFVGVSVADKRKLEFAPETGPEPRPVPQVPPITQPSPHYLEGHPPQYRPVAPPAPEAARRTASTGNRCCENATVTKAYHVADLVIPVPTVGATPTDKPKTMERELIRKITTAVEPKSWLSAGGEGTIDYFPIGMALVVKGTPDVQAAVGRYLDAVRKMQDQQVITEARLLTVSDAWFEATGLHRHFAPSKGETKPSAKCCSPGEAARLLRCAQGDAGTTVHAAPRLTCLNGQPGRIRIGETEHFLSGLSISTVAGQLVYEPKNEAHELGVDVTLEPAVAADGRSVRLTVNGAVRELAVRPVPTTPITTLIPPAADKGRRGEPAPFTQHIQQPTIAARKVADTVVVPDGGTVVLYGGKATLEETVKEPLPTLGDVPFLATVFAKDRKVTTTNHLLVMVSARVVKPDAGCDECVQCAGGNAQLAGLMADYARACREGQTDLARRLAMECLVIDPTCFGTK